MTIKRDTRRGTWYFVVDVPSPGGRRRQLKRRGFVTKKAALEAEAAVIADSARGTFVRTTKVTLGAFLRDEWMPAKRPGLRDSTANAYDRMIELYVAPNLGGVALAKVDGSMLNGLYGRLLTEGRTETRRNLGPGL